MKEYSISPKMQKAAILIVQGEKLKDVAQTCKVSPQTLSEWRSQEFFEVLCNRLQKSILDASEAKLVGLTSKALATLESMLDSDNEKIQMEASKEILRMTNLGNNFRIGATTLKEILYGKVYDFSMPYELNDLQKEVEQAIQEASICDV